MHLRDQLQDVQMDAQLKEIALIQLLEFTKKIEAGWLIEVAGIDRVYYRVAGITILVINFFAISKYLFVKSKYILIPVL